MKSKRLGLTDDQEEEEKEVVKLEEIRRCTEVEEKITPASRESIEWRFV